MKEIAEFIQKGEIYETSGEFARSRSQRRKGLSGIELKDSPDELIFEHCRSIHTFGMKFELEVIFVDKNYRVLQSRIVQPRRIAIGPRGTYATIERPLR